MTTAVKFVPNLHENTETRGIIATDTMHLDVEVPNEYKVWLSTPSTNVTNRGLQFQATNTNKFLDSNTRLDLNIQFKYKGKTFSATGDVTASPASTAQLTPPTLWNPLNCKIDAFAVNKLIQRITFNIQNKQWTEEQRTPELFDVLASQFDLEKLESYGIDPFSDQGQLKLSYLYGRGFVSRSDLKKIKLDLNKGFDVSVMPSRENATTVMKAIEKGYITVKSTFKNLATGAQLDTINDAIYGDRPTTSAGVIWYSDLNGDAELEQTVNLTIHEYIISPSLSNPYTKNKYSKSYYVGNYPVNITFDFNTEYFRTMIKNLVPAYKDGASTVHTPSLTSSPQIQQSNLNFYTFDSSREIVNPYQRTLYYNLDFQTMNNVKISSDDTGLKEASITTANLSSLRPYVMGWISMRITENSDLVTGTGAPNDVSTLATYEFQDIQYLRFEYGSQTDCMLGSQLTWREIVDITEDCIGNPKLRNMILGNLMLDQAGGCLLDYSQSGLNYTNANNTDYDLYIKKATYRKGMQFFMIPTCKLNWRPILQSDVPTIPEFNYGSNHYKSLIVKIGWNQTYNDRNIIASPVDVTFQPVVILADKRVRSIPMDGQGPLFDERVEYDYINDNASLSSILDSFFMKNNSSYGVNSELQFVGGSFIGNVVDKVSRVIPHLISAAPHLKQAYEAVASGRRGRPNKRR